MRFITLFAFLSVLVSCSKSSGNISENQLPVSNKTSAIQDNLTRTQLEYYLSHALQMYELCKDNKFLQWGGRYNYKEDDKRMILNTGAKFLGRTIYSWGEEEKFLQPRFLGYAKAVIDTMHAADPEIAFQACIFEIVTTKVNNITVPSWVFTAFDLPVENRNFNYTDMLYLNGSRVNQWGTGQSVPDISRLETRLWFYYQAKKYIDIGIEAIHFGQVEIMAENDKNNNYAGWQDILGRVRSYAHLRARRHIVLCDGHVPGGGLVDNEGNLLLDFHSFPLRPKEVIEPPQEAILENGYIDAFYNRSKGGITPSGWSCDHLPYVVEFDSFGNTNHIGQSDGNPWDFDVWGYDEIGWFSAQTEEYRNYWLTYAWNWVRTNDPNGYIIMPGAGPGTLFWNEKFRANTNSDACPVGKNAEETIKSIWGN